jgi:hypothetical protein
VYNYQNSSEKENHPVNKEEKLRKPYRSPRLEQLGDLRSLTLGSSQPTPFLDSDVRLGPFSPYP